MYFSVSTHAGKDCFWEGNKYLYYFLYYQYRELVSRREARRARRAAMLKRRTAAAAERMRVISRLAAAGDEFGTHDSDWDAYKRLVETLEQ